MPDNKFRAVYGLVLQRSQPPACQRTACATPESRVPSIFCGCPVCAGRGRSLSTPRLTAADRAHVRYPPFWCAGRGAAAGAVRVRSRLCHSCHHRRLRLRVARAGLARGFGIVETTEWFALLRHRLAVGVILFHPSLENFLIDYRREGAIKKA